MKIAILTYGSQGDVEPFIALGHRFCRAGHHVRLAAPEAYQSHFDLRDVEFIPLPGEPAQLVQELVDQAGMNTIKIVQQMSKFVVPLAQEVFHQSRTACLNAELIIHSFLLTSTGIGLAKEMGIPHISAQLFPVFSSTAEFPAPTFPDLPLGGSYRRLTHYLVSLIFKWASRFLYQRVRMKNPHLPNLTSWIPGDSGDGQSPILYGFSSHVVPKPRDWKANAHITGYWLLSNQNEQSPAREVVDFMQAGPPPIAITFGSTQSRKLSEIKLKVIEALIRCKQRGIIVAAKPDSRHSSPDVLQVDYVPYNWLFKRSALIIHHGGAGTTAKGLTAGVPNIILPFTSDQPFWGRRVYALGAGPRPIPARNLSTRALTDAINQAITNKKMRKEAELIGERLRKEDGVSQAIKIVENYLERYQINT